MTEWTIEFHKNFYKDLNGLSKSELHIVDKKRKKIGANPERQKHLSGGEQCYREPITRNVRLIYHVRGNSIWFLTIGRHDKAYDEYRKRLQSLRFALQ